MSAMSSYWWDACNDKQKIHWIAWEKMCLSKENGGLGFKDIELSLTRLYLPNKLGAFSTIHIAFWRRCIRGGTTHRLTS